jgi:LacI family transcriptional regulator
MKFNQITIKDIARELGISPSTVSRALKDHPDISKDTKKAVNELAEKLNYQPNIVALNLRQKKTNTIGVIIPEVVHFFFSTVISGIEDVAYSAGYNVIFAQSNESYQREVAHVKTMFNSRVDGLLLSLSRETTNFDHVESIISKGVPIVFYDRMYNSPTSSKVIVDDYAGAKEAVNHLIEQGCKQIAHIIGAPNLIISSDRLRGYSDALKENKIEINNDLIIQSESGTFEEGKKLTQALLASKKGVDAIFCNNDPLAMGAMMAIKEKGLRIPQDIAIVGFSNWFFGELMEPSLTSIDQPGFEMGQEAARILIRQIDMKVKDLGEPIQETKVLKTKLIIRESSMKKQPKSAKK